MRGADRMLESELSEFVSAGFLITREVTRPAYSSPTLLPDRILSASNCIAPFIPDTWCIDWTQDTPENRLEDAKAFELDASGLATATAWATQHFGARIGWPNVIMDLPSAQELVALVLSHLPDVKVLELALHRTMTADFCRAAEPSPPQPGFAPAGRQGIHEAIRTQTAPTPGGNILGFEPLVFDHALSCSWLCNGLDTVVEQALGIRPNQQGLMDTFDQARTCVEYISRDQVGAEPGLWLPWLMIDHS